MISALERRIAEIARREEFEFEFDANRVNRSVKEMRALAWQIAYLRASPARRAHVDHAQRNGVELWP